MRPLSLPVVIVFALLSGACDFDYARGIFCNGSVVCPDAGSDAGSDAGMPNYVFVTSTSIAPGGLGGVEAADALCQGLADRAHLRGTFRAYLPSGTESALSRLRGARGWLRPDGRPSIDQITDNFDTGRSMYPPVLTEQGVAITGAYVATGTLGDGGASPDTCALWTKNADDAGVTIGSTWNTGPGNWSTAATGLCNSYWRLYCFGIDNYFPLNPATPVAARWAFVTRNGYAIGNGVFGADLACQNEASAAGLPGSYLAFIAAAGRSAGSRFDPRGPNWYRVDNIALASGPDELVDAGVNWAPLAVLKLTADGIYEHVVVWTGAGSPQTVVTGTTTTCADWTSTTATATVGNTWDLSANYFAWATDSSCTGSHALYCLQE